VSVRDDLSREVEALNNELAEFARKLKVTNQKAAKVAKEDPIPVQFVGMVRSYRYAAGRKGELPTHRFEMECGSGLWLFVSCSSQEFDRFMMNMDMDGTDPVGKVLNGKVISVERNAGNNSLVPKEYYGERLGGDANGKMLYKGAKVKIGSLTGTVDRLDEEDAQIVLTGVDGYDSGYFANTYDIVRID
jgi:hypothetical protein